MTYKILNGMTWKILFPSWIKHADLVPNRRVFVYDNDGDEPSADENQSPNTEYSDGGHTIPEIVPGPPVRPMAVLDADDLMSRTYLTEPDKDVNSRAS